jgi:HlyD family secretion protein
MQDVVKRRLSGIKTVPKGWIGLSGVALFVMAGTTLYWRSQSPPTPEPTAPIVTQPVLKTVTALGRLEPKGEVIKVSAASAAGGGNKVDQLLVKEGDRVQKGQVIAVLNDREKRQAALLKAQRAVQVAQAELAKIRAGAKRGEINAQSATVASLKAKQQQQINAASASLRQLEVQKVNEVAAQQATLERAVAERENAAAEAQRYQSLQRQGAISASEWDAKRLALSKAQTTENEARSNLNRIQETLNQQINAARANLQQAQNTAAPDLSAAKANLDSISEVRGVDVQAAQAEVQSALADVAEAKADLEQVYVRAPQSGVVLEIYTHAGESVSSDGIIEMGQTSAMTAIAEVYQSDIQRLRPGQKVNVTSEALSGKLTGTVDWIDSKVRRQTVINTDPSTNIDSRVVEVHVKLDPASSQQAAKFTNLQVQVEVTL